MAITKLTSGYETDLLLMDGTAAIRDLISDTAFTMTGGPSTAALLGATAPVISAAGYTSCKISSATIGLTPGMPLSIMCVVDTTWAGNDGANHYLWTNGIDPPAANSVALYKNTANSLLIAVRDAVPNLKYKSIAVNATNWAAGKHIVIATFSAANILGLYLDGTAATTSGGTNGRETAVGAFQFIGSTVAAASWVTGAILCAMWGRVLSAGEITALSSLAAWSTLTDITVSGLATGNAARIYNGVDIEDSAVEAGGSVTLTPAGPHASRILRIYEDNSYATLIDELVGT